MPDPVDYNVANRAMKKLCKKAGLKEHRTIKESCVQYSDKMIIPPIKAIDGNKKAKGIVSTCYEHCQLALEPAYKGGFSHSCLLV